MKERMLGNLALSEIGYLRHARRLDVLSQNGAFVDLLKRITGGKSATPAQITPARLFTRRDYIVPIPGTTKLHRLKESIGAALANITAAGSAMARMEAPVKESL